MRDEAAYTAALFGVRPIPQVTPIIHSRL